MTELPPGMPPILEYNQPIQRTSALAVTSVALGAVAIPLDIALYLGVLIGLIGVIFGVVSLVLIRRRPNLKGRAIAITGIILGGLAMMIGITCGLAISGNL